VPGPPIDEQEAGGAALRNMLESCDDEVTHGLLRPTTAQGAQIEIARPHASATYDGRSSSVAPRESGAGLPNVGALVWNLLEATNGSRAQQLGAEHRSPSGLSDWRR
jgi:hypothetical protein